MEDETIIKCGIFTLKNDQYAINMNYIDAFVNIDKVNRISCINNNYLRGMMKTRGNIYAVFDTRQICSYNNLETEIKELPSLIEEFRSDYLFWFMDLQQAITSKS